MKKPSIIFVVAIRAKVNFILRSELIPLLKERGFPIVIVSPFYNDPDFQKEFKDSEVSLEPLLKKGRATSFINNFRYEALKIKHSDLEKTERVYKHLKRRFGNPSIERKKRILKRLVKFIPKVYRENPSWWDFVEKIFVHKKAYRKIFMRHNPGMVVVDDPNSEFIIYAIRYQIPSMFLDINLDAFTTRFTAYLRPLTIIAATSKAMKQEIMELQRIPAEKIMVTGILRSDFHRLRFKPMAREDFFRTIHADPSKKLITFGAKTPLFYPHNADIIKIILDGIKKGTFETPAQLMVRFDPNHDPMNYKDLLPDILFESADIKNHQDHVANLLYHSDIVISVSSSFSSEAVLLGTPALWIAFDGFTRYADHKDSYKYSYEIPLMRRLLSSGGIPLIENQEMLLKYIHDYLKDPSLDQEKRARFIEEEYAPADGHVADRVADLIVKYAKNS